jgi:dolichyl-phosphate beta-glucosyltransferase
VSPTIAFTTLAAPVLSFLIPAYNESARLGATLGQVLAYLQAQPYRSEVLVIDDGSTDDTVAVAEEYFATHQGRVATRVLSYLPNRGKGYAVRQGLLAAQGAVAIFSDADLSTPIEEVPTVLEPILGGTYDVVFGSRALRGSVIGQHQPWLREASGRFFNRIVRLATGLPYADTQCGFKAFRLDICHPVIEGAQLDRFGFDVELLFLAHRSGLRLREQAVRWNDATGSKVGILSGLHGFRELWQLRQYYQQGAYDATLARTRIVASHRVPLPGVII